jgi:hypothetical protein
LVKVVVGAVVAVILVFFGIGLFTFFVPQESDFDADFEPDTEVGALGADAPDADVIAEDELTLVSFSYQRDVESIEGSVMNTAELPVVNVQVAFALYGASEELGSVADTTSQLGPGETWRFSIPVIEAGAIDEVVPTRLTGTPKAPLDGDEEPM